MAARSTAPRPCALLLVMAAVVACAPETRTIFRASELPDGGDETSADAAPVPTGGSGGQVGGPEAGASGGAAAGGAGTAGQPAAGTAGAVTATGGAIAGAGGAIGGGGGVVGGAAGKPVAGSGGAMTAGAGGTSTLADGLVAWWRLDEASGSTVAKDATANHNDATLSGLSAGAAWTTGHAGGALTCDGSGGALAADSSSLDQIGSALSIAAWIKPTSSVTGYSVLLSREIGTSFGEHYWIGLQDGRPGFLGDPGGLFLGSALTIGQWVHLAVTHDGSTLRLYVDGALAGSKALPGSFAPDTSQLALCGNQNDASGAIGERWVGLVDDLRLYRRALTDAEIAQLAR